MAATRNRELLMNLSCSMDRCSLIPVSSATPETGSQSRCRSTLLPVRKPAHKSLKIPAQSRVRLFAPTEGQMKHGNARTESANI